MILGLHRYINGAVLLKGSSGGSGGSGGSGSATTQTSESPAPLPAGVTRRDISEFLGDGAISYDFVEAGNNVEVMITPAGRSALSVDFLVNGGFTASAATGTANQAIASKVSQIFRHDISRRPEGQRFRATPHRTDSRGGFREALYARAGFSFAGGATAPGGRGPQHGKVVNGRLIPTDSRGNIFSSAQQQAHRANIRQALRAGIRAARGN